MFKTDPTYRKRIFKKLDAICEDETVKKCYKNREEFGCRYCDYIENTLDELDKLVKKDEEIPWWVSLLD